MALKIPAPSYPTRSLQFLSLLKDGSHTNPIRGNDIKANFADDRPAVIPLRIIVVGAGLGGLSAAIALARRGHSVTILEQAPKLGEVGAGIQIPSNSSRILLCWGLGPFLDSKVVEPEAMSFLRWKNEKKIAHTKLVPDVRQNFGAPYFVVHRAHFHDALHQLAIKLGVLIYTDSKVEFYDEDAAAVHLQDGIHDNRLIKIIYMIEHALKWPLMSGRPLSNWIAKSNRLLIIGDAAHAMVPYMSQGAAMAVEDGAALGEILSLVEKKEELPQALELYRQVRSKRTYQMQEASLLNGKLWHFSDGPEQMARDAATKAEVEGRHFVASANQWSDPVTQWWAYGYDAVEEIAKAWNEMKNPAKSGT